MKSIENIIKWVLLSFCAHFYLDYLSVLTSYCWMCLNVWGVFIREHVYTYIYRHMFLVRNYHTPCLWYSLSNGCWLNKDPLNLGGVFIPPPHTPSAGTHQALLQTPQDVAPKAEHGKAPLDYSIKGIIWVFLGRKQILILTAQFPFKDSHVCHFVTWLKSTGLLIYIHIVCFSPTLRYYMIIWLFVYYVKGNYRAALATSLHHLWWRCHCECFPFHCFPRSKLPLFPYWKFPVAAAGSTDRLSNRCFVKKREKRIFLSLYGIDESINRAWIKVLCKGKCSLESFVTHNVPTLPQRWLSWLIAELVPAGVGRQNDRKAKAVLSSIVKVCPHRHAHMTSLQSWETHIHSVRNMWFKLKSNREEERWLAK